MTWLAQDVANAIATVQKRLAEQPTLRLVHDDLEDDEAAPGEDCPQTVARLQRELAEARATIAGQQTVIRGERAQKETALETIRAMFAAMAIPDAQMDARTKLVYMFTGREAASRNSRGIVNLPNAAIAGGTGLPEKAVSEIMQDIQARERSPIARRITREWVTVADGIQEPRSVAEVSVTTDDRTYLSVLRAASAMGGPSDASQRKKDQARARAKQSVQARIVDRSAAWGECPGHDNPDVTVRGHCPECGEVVGERIMRVEEFAALNPAVRDSGDGEPTSPVYVVPKPPALRDSAAAPPSLLDFAVSRSQERPARCPAPDCRAMEFQRLPDGSWRCLKSRHDPSVYKFSAVVGARVAPHRTVVMRQP